MRDRISPARCLTTTVGKRGTVVIPKELREKHQLNEGCLVIIEEKEGGLFLRSAVAIPAEAYTAERRAGFILSSAMNKQEYKSARSEVQRMGFDPDKIPHFRPNEGQK